MKLCIMVGKYNVSEKTIYIQPCLNVGDSRFRQKVGICLPRLYITVILIFTMKNCE
jgi:hypothetical protein